MNFNRRNFIKTTGAAGLTVPLLHCTREQYEANSEPEQKLIEAANKPINNNMKTKFKLAIFICLLTFVETSAQTRVLSGEVFLFDDLKLQNIIIEAKKSGANAITDSMGNFSIVCEQKDQLSFNGNAFKPKKLKITPKTEHVIVSLRFKDAPEIIEKAAQNGYISSSDVSRAKAKLDENEVDFCKYNDIYELIEGRIAGVRVMENKDILIRGATSLNGNNAALLIVDGREVSTLSDVSPCEVKKIDFLKNGSGSIYGSRAAAGVVIVVTKSSNP